MKARAAASRTLGILALAAGLSACDMPFPAEEFSPPPAGTGGGTLRSTPLAPSEESEAMRAYFKRAEMNLLAQGLLRRDGGGADTPFNERQLVENFVRIALYDEYINVGGSLVARQTASRLRRWDRPIRLNVEFGASVPASQRNVDMRNISSYVGRLARVSGHPMRLSEDQPNFTVLVVNEDERRNIGPRLSALVRGIDRVAIESIQSMSPSTFCLVYAFSDGASPTYTQAVAVIRAEHSDILRLSCIHEEIAQGMGLANDSPAARPSIFNDDEEFGLLTRHDELLLKMLYDPRLRPGMTEAEARPIAQIIAREMLGGAS